MSTFYFLYFYFLAGAPSARAAPVLFLEVHDLGCDSAGADAQPSDTGCEVEAARPGGPGVDCHTTLGLGDERTVGMSVDQHSLRISLEEALRCRDTDLMAVTDMDVDAPCGVHDIGCQGGGRRIGVAENGPHRGDQSELVQHGIATHIARVQDHLDPGERDVHTRANEAVRVRDQPDEVFTRASQSTRPV